MKRGILEVILPVLVLGCSGPAGPEGRAGAEGAPGQADPPGPAGATGEPGASATIAAGSITSEHIADGAVTRGKLARESVLPENRGRSNSVRSFFVSRRANNTASGATVYTVPAGKTFVVTDVVAFNPVGPGVSVIALLNGPADPADFFASDIRAMVLSGTNATPQHVGFQAGIRYDAGEMLVITGAGLDVTISGYEF